MQQGWVTTHWNHTLLRSLSVTLLLAGFMSTVRAHILEASLHVCPASAAMQTCLYLDIRAASPGQHHLHLSHPR